MVAIKATVILGAILDHTRMAPILFYNLSQLLG